MQILHDGFFGKLHLLDSDAFSPWARAPQSPCFTCQVSAFLICKTGRCLSRGCGEARTRQDVQRGGHSTSQGEFSRGSPRRSSGRRAWGRGGLDVSRCAFVCTCLKPRPPLSKKVALRGGTQTGLRQGPSWKCERCTPAPAGTSAVHASTAPGDAPQPADPRTRAKDSQPPRGKRHLGPSRVPVLLFLFDLQRRFWPFCAAGGARTEDPSSR